MKFHSCILAVSVAALLGCAEAGDDCAAGGGITPICGFLAPEDLEAIPGHDALLVGGFSLDNENGDLRVLDLATGEVDVIYPPDSGPELAAEDAPWGDPACPGPPDGFAAHGIHLSENGENFTLLVVNHTSREAVEFFEVDETEGRFRAAWRGCVIVDEELWINDLAVLPSGGFVASHMMPREIAGTLFDRPPNDRVESGYLVEWTRQGGWQRIAGTEGALPNGVQVSPDGTVLYNSHYLSDQVVAIERATGKRLWTAPVHGAPDNLSTRPDGNLLVSTHTVSLREIRECLSKPAPFCGHGFTVHGIDVASGEAEQIFASEGPPFGGSTVSVQAGDTIYLGAYAGNRVGSIPAP